MSHRDKFDGFLTTAGNLLWCVGIGAGLGLALWAFGALVFGWPISRQGIDCLALN